MRKLKTAFLALWALLPLSQVWAFCGFYVAKADAKLFNETSQVIIVRDGTQTIVTMSSDYKGDLKDFAMVVPVPEVLKKKQVRTVNANIFAKADAYSAPRIVEYHDPRICPYDYAYDIPMELDDLKMVTAESAPVTRKSVNKKKYQVKIEEEFSVDEYDVIILSAKESDGLEMWLHDNGYKIPEGAKEVLEPYIKSQMKFFVVKVNLDKKPNSPTTTLNPLQITYNSNNFMLPIRLGMANAKGDQDMLVYTFTRKGRVETTNYRTTQIPTDRDIPLFVQQRFGEFYKDAFARSWKKEGKNTVWLEYAWDISATNPVKCDPCNSALFTYAELKDAGVFWMEDGGWGQYKGDLFMTRLHVRYNRSTFPQDLAFQITPNQTNFQGRYVTRHPSPGPFECDQAIDYLKQLRNRREAEVHELAALTGWKTGQFEGYIHEYDQYLPKPRKTPKVEPEDGGNGLLNPSPNKDSVPAGTLSPKQEIIPEVEEMIGQASPKVPQDTFIPEVIEKSEDPEYMAAQAPQESKKSWWMIPLLILGIAMVLGISRKPRKNL